MSCSYYENLAADDLNLSSSANELVLYDPSMTVTRGGGHNPFVHWNGADKPGQEME